MTDAVCACYGKSVCAATSFCRIRLR